MNDKPTQQQIATYLNWLKDPDGDEKPQMALPLSADINAEASPACAESLFNIIPSANPAQRQNGAQSESESKSRIRCLAVAGMSIPEIALRTGLHPKYVQAVIEPGRLSRRHVT